MKTGIEKTKELLSIYRQQYEVIGKMIIAYEQKLQLLSAQIMITKTHSKNRMYQNPKKKISKTDI